MIGKKENKTVRQKKPVPKVMHEMTLTGWQKLLMPALVVLVSFIVYLPVLKNGFVWDDQYYVISNELLKQISLEAIFKQNVGGNYHPFTILVLAIEYHFLGLNATGYHAVNLLLHLLNVILVYHAVNLLCEKPVVAMVASLLFGIHPIHVESVAWISEIKDLLYTFFFLAAYIFYLRYQGNRRKILFAAALLMFAFSLLSKAMAASLPVLLLLTDYYKGRKINMPVLLEKIPFLLPALVFGVVAVLAQKDSNFIQDSAAFTFPQRVAFACYGFITYLYKMLIPLHLSAYYPYPPKTGESIPAWYYMYIVLFAMFAAAMVFTIRRTRKIIFGTGFFAVTIFLVLQLLPVGGAVMADRYSYIPSIGIFYLAGEGVYLLWNRKIKWLAIMLVGVFSVFFCAKTYARCAVWKNGMTLWSDVIEQYQTIPLAFYNRGVYLMNTGRYEGALSDFNKAISLAPAHFEAFNNRGNLFMNNNLYDQALNDFNKAIGIKPDFGKPYYNRGIIFMKQQKYALAEKDFTKAMELNIKDFETYVNRGYVRMYQAEYEGSLKDFNAAIEMKPGEFQAYVNRGSLFMMQQRNEEALLDFGRAIELKPDQGIAYHNCGVIYYNEKRYDEAIRSYSTAIGLQPDYTEAYFNRALAEFYSGKKDQACEDMKHAAGLGSRPAVEAMAQICR
jgi:tetratricopeptide (TPR) repeat protein